MTMNDFSSTLAIIEEALRRLNRSVLLGALKEGLPAETVRLALEAGGLAATEELESLYGWRNGTSSTRIAAVDDIQFFPGFYMISLEDALANYRAFASDARWSIGWLPVFANGGVDFYVLDLSSSNYGTVRHFRLGEFDHPIEFGSLGAMLGTLASAFEQGIFYLDSHGYLEMDDLVFGKLAAGLNPGIGWWCD